MKTILSLLLISLLLIPHVYAQDKAADADKIFAWVKPGEPGCAAAVSENGKVVVNKAYGMADLERDVPIGPNTIFDAGSVVKQFIAVSILLLVEDGKLALTDDIRKHIPEFHDFGHKVTIDNLLTHTGGIRDWTGLRPMAAGEPDVLALVIRQRGLESIPGAEWSYSNSGYELLREIVTRASGMTLADFMKKRLWDPLGMKSSAYVADMTDVVKNRAMAYRKDKDRWKLDMYLGKDRGGGGLFTTPVDLLTWNDALLNNKLGAFVTEKLKEPVTLKNGRKVSYSRAQHLEPFRGGGTMLWHSGGAAGYSAVTGRLPEKGLSFAIMCNVDGGARSAYAGRLLNLFLPPGSINETPPPANPEKIETGDLSGRAGLYFNELDGRSIYLAVNNNNLVIAGGGPLVPLAADRFRNQRPTLFFMSEAAFEMQFTAADRFEIKTKDGETSRYRRPEAWTPTAEDLAAFAGRFRSDEIGGYFDITIGKDGLAGRANDSSGPSLQFKPVARDTFQLERVTLRFKRDKSGKIVAVEYSNPVVHDIKFTRVN